MAKVSASNLVGDSESSPVGSGAKMPDVPDAPINL